MLVQPGIRAAQGICLLVRRLWVTLWMLCLVGMGCSEGMPSMDGPVLPPNFLPATPDLSATAAALGGHLRDTDWIDLGQGVTGRRMLVERAERLAPVSIVRLDPIAVSFHVGYSPEIPRPFSAWCDDAGVIAAINGGFFDANYASTALVISDGIASGSSYEGQGGMFTVDADGEVALRYLGDAPYSSDEMLVQGLQGWPMLIRPGGEVLHPGTESGERARRSVIAVDRAGLVLLIAFPGSDFTLRELADWLASSDLELDAALNLDGGSSTALCLKTAQYQERIDPFGPLPLVLQVSSR